MSELRGQAWIVVAVLLAAVAFLVLTPRAETQQACAFSVRIDGTPVTIPVQSDGVIVVEVGADGYSTRTEHRCTPQAPLPVPTATPTSAPSVPACSTSLQSLIDQAPSGSTLTLGACIYREAVTVGKPLTLNGQGHAEIRGSDVWTQWNQGVQRWTSVRTIPPFDPETSSAQFSDEFQARHPEQVFIDGTEQRQVADNPAAGQFTLDGNRRVILGTNPTGKMVEVTVRKTWLLPQADDVTIRGLVMKHVGTHGQGWAIGNNGRFRFTLTESTLSDAHGGIVAVGGGDSRTNIVNNTLARAGNTAIGGYLATSGTIRRNTITQSGFGGWDWGWQSGGIKLADSDNIVIEDNHVFDNDGPGIWCDIDCDNATIRNNRVRNNPGPGIFFEISTGVLITGNVVINTGKPGYPAIYISSAGSAEVSQNLVYDSFRGIQLYADNRPDAQPLTNNFVHDNTIVMTTGGEFSLLAADFGSGVAVNPASNNRGLNNRVWYPTPEVTGQLRFWWAPNQFWDIARFAQTPLGQGIRYLTNDEKDQLLGGIH
jgi:parallel beta-helix repeat protein